MGAIASDFLSWVEDAKRLEYPAPRGVEMDDREVEKVVVCDTQSESEKCSSLDLRSQIDTQNAETSGPPDKG